MKMLQKNASYEALAIESCECIDNWKSLKQAIMQSNQLVVLKVMQLLAKWIKLPIKNKH